MNSLQKPGRVLVVDDGSFQKVCSAILNLAGHEAIPIEDLSEFCSSDSFSCQLVVASFPFRNGFLEHIRDLEVPVLVLADAVTSDLVESLKKLNATRCLIKPLDFEKFRTVVSDMVANSTI